MTEGIETAFIRANLLAIRILKAFAYDDHAETKPLNRFLNFCEKSFLLKRDFGNEHNVRSIVVFPMGQRGAASDPTGRTPHHLHDATSAVVGCHGADIQRDFS